MAESYPFLNRYGQSAHCVLDTLPGARDAALMRQTRVLLSQSLLRCGEDGYKTQINGNCTVISIMKD